MKTLLYATVLFPAALVADSATDYVNFIRQIQQDSGVEWDITVTPEGNQVSPTGVSTDGSFFELWSVHNTTASEYLLDEQFVTSYTPNAVVDIVTADPYGPVRRTRCDQPFQVQVTVSGLLDPADPLYPTAPDASKMVDYSHSIFSYPDGEHSLENVTAPVGYLIEEGTMESNATATVTFTVTNLTGDDLTSVEGEEVFTVSALADFGVSASILDSERVQIWPVAKGALTGYDSSAYYEDVPPITVSLTDLYPDSTTYVRMYPGSPQSNPTNAKNISESYGMFTESIPQDRTLVLKKLDRYFTEEGYHTLEILHETPFGTDLLHTGTIRVDRTIEFTGGLNVRE